ncbi:MAG TPA: hypothetical protein DCX95_07910 [Elusimicrobia bacterium]|nr:hypothetical protein [Elusimicrobiota bacterium]
MDRKNYQILKGVMLSEAKHLAVQQRDSSPSAQNDGYKTISGLARMSSPPHKLADPPLAEISSGEELMTPASPAAIYSGARKKFLKSLNLQLILSRSKLQSEWQTSVSRKFVSERHFRAGMDVLQKILRGKIFWRLRALPGI